MRLPSPPLIEISPVCIWGREQTNEWTLRQALEHVWRTRPLVLPNAGFFDQLLELEKLLFAL